MKLLSTFSRVTNDTRAWEAGAPLGTPNPLRPGRSWKNARALRSRLMLAIVVRRQCTSLSGSELAIDAVQQLSLFQTVVGYTGSAELGLLMSAVNIDVAISMDKPIFI